MDINGGISLITRPVEWNSITVAEGEEYTDQNLGVDYWLEDWSVFRKVVFITKGYCVFTGYETHWKGTPDMRKVFHRVKI
jgi:hypothetical protein